MPRPDPDMTTYPTSEIRDTLRAVALVSEAWLKSCDVGTDDYRRAIRVHGAVEYALSVAIEEHEHADGPAKPDPDAGGDPAGDPAAPVQACCPTFTNGPMNGHTPRPIAHDPFCPTVAPETSALRTDVLDPDTTLGALEARGVRVVHTFDVSGTGPQESIAEMFRGGAPPDLFETVDLWELEVAATPGSIQAVLAEAKIPAPGITVGGRLGVTMAGDFLRMQRCRDALVERGYRTVLTSRQ